MEIDIRTIEKLKNDFAPKVYYGKTLPDKKAVSDGTTFFLQSSESILIEHIMLKGKWWKKVVNSNSEVALKEV